METFTALMMGVVAANAGGGFDPGTLGLNGWWDMSDDQYLFQATGETTPVTANGQNVLSVTDRSGTGAFLDDSGGSPFPVWNSSGYVTFANSELTPDINPLPGVMIAVVRYNVSSTSGDAVCGIGAGGEHLETTGSFHAFQGITSTVADTQLAVIIANEESGDIVFYIDGANIGTDSGNTIGASTFRIGGPGGGSSENLMGDVFEVMTRGTGLTAQEISDVTGYLKTKHGIA